MLSHPPHAAERPSVLLADVRTPMRSMKRSLLELTNVFCDCDSKCNIYAVMAAKWKIFIYTASIIATVSIKSFQRSRCLHCALDHNNKNAYPYPLRIEDSGKHSCW